MKRTRPRLISEKTAERNKIWLNICIDRATYLAGKYGRIICEYSGETIYHLTKTFNAPDDAWGHHMDRNRNNCSPENCYIVKYKYHRWIHDNNIQVEQEDFRKRL